MAEVNGQNVEQVVADALRLALVEDGFVATDAVEEYQNRAFVALREEVDGTTIGVRVTVQPVVINIPNVPF